VILLFNILNGRRGLGNFPSQLFTKFYDGRKQIFEKVKEYKYFSEKMEK